MQVASDADIGAASVVGPLNALEADRFVEDLSTIAFEDVGGHRWMHQHECLEKLNIQAHVNASQQRDEFVMEALVLHQKIPLLIRELVASELWKANAFPLLKDWLAEHNSVKGYLLLYHEAVICNLLEAVLYHKEACEAAGELIAELADYCHRKVVWLLGQKPPPRPSDKEALKKQLLKEAEAEYLEKQAHAIAMSSAMYCLSILRFLTDHMAELPLAVTTRLLDTYDVLMVLCPLLELKPWQLTAEDGTLRRYAQGAWANVPEGEARKMHRCEAQAWLTVYNLVGSAEVRRKYHFNSFRKSTLMRLRGFLHEGTVDQIPLLVELGRAIDEMSLMEAPAAQSQPVYVLEHLDDLRVAMAKGVDWAAVVAAQKADALNDSEEAQRAHARMLAGMYDIDGIDALYDGGKGEAPKLSFFVELTATDGDGSELLRVVGESEGGELGEQTAFKISNDDKRRLLPAAANGVATLSASLNLGEGKPLTQSAPLHLLENTKKQWIQIGSDAHSLRLQLQFLAAADGTGYHITHCRVTPPHRQTLTLTFAADADGAAERTVTAHGRGLAPQTPFTLTPESASVRVPRSCRVAATLDSGGGESWALEATALQLDAASQMVWRQLGARPSQLRVQLKLVPAAGGYTVTTVRVTAPADARGAAPAPAAKAPAVSAPAPRRRPRLRRRRWSRSRQRRCEPARWRRCRRRSGRRDSRVVANGRLTARGRGEAEAEAEAEAVAAAKAEARRRRWRRSATHA